MCGVSRVFLDNKFFSFFWALIPATHFRYRARLLGFNLGSCGLGLTLMATKNRWPPWVPGGARLWGFALGSLSG